MTKTLGSHFQFNKILFHQSINSQIIQELEQQTSRKYLCKFVKLFQIFLQFIM